MSTDNAIRYATYDFLLVFYSDYSAISHGNPVFQQMTLIWTYQGHQGQTDYVIRFASYKLLLVFYSNYTLSRTETVLFQQMTMILTFQGHQRSNWLCHPIRDLWLPISVSCFIVTTALSRTETLFFSRWPWSDRSGSPHVKLIMPSDPRPIVSY